MSNIAERLDRAYAQIENSAKAHNRQSPDITLLAVSKTKPFSDIEAAYTHGHRAFGENYPQEGAEKVQLARQAKLSEIEWHFIGPLQSNKTKLIAENFDWMQSVDRLKIAQRLNEQRPPTMPPLQVLIQVNISHEENKSGIAPEEIKTLAEHISKLPNLNLRGLMAIPLATNEQSTLSNMFTQMHDCFLSLKAQYPQVDTLSMGMSSDLDAAIKAGSTMVRVGTAIFGAREYKNT